MRNITSFHSTGPQLQICGHRLYPIMNRADSLWGTDEKRFNTAHILQNNTNIWKYEVLSDTPVAGLRFFVVCDPDWTSLGQSNPTPGPQRRGHGEGDRPNRNPIGPLFLVHNLQAAEREERREERKTDPEFVKKRKGRSVELYLLLHGNMDYTREKMNIIFSADLKRIDYNF